MLPLIFLAPFLSDLIVRGLPLPVWMTALAALISGGWYALALSFLLWPKTRFDPSLPSLRELTILVAAAVVSSAAVALSYAGLLTAASLLSPANFATAALRYWVGDMIGIAILVPFGLLAVTRERLIRLDWQTASQALAIIAALGVAATAGRDDRLQLFYLLFLPVTWIAVRSGLEGVSVALVVTQAGLFAALQFTPAQGGDITGLQARMLVLAVTGLVAGALVTERRRVESELRRNQAAIARLSRLGSMGGLAAAIAHEVNQPLSAAGTYSRIVAEGLEAETLSDPSLAATAQKAAAQIERAATVIRRLRALVRLGRSDMSPVCIARVVHEALDLVRPVLERSSIAISVEVENGLPPVMADRIQIEQMLINLLRNAAEAIAGSARPGGRISLEAVKTGPRLLEIRVRDTGPGFPAGLANGEPVLFASSKADGLGVGLSLCRSIAEAHGGRLRVESCTGGALASFTLPIAESPDHAG
jgi:two-component system, LuxR family, sensor kinase FixL